MPKTFAPICPGLPTHDARGCELIYMTVVRNLIGQVIGRVIHPAPLPLTENKPVARDLFCVARRNFFCTKVPRSGHSR